MLNLVKSSKLGLVVYDNVDSMEIPLLEVSLAKQLDHVQTLFEQAEFYILSVSMSLTRLSWSSCCCSPSTFEQGKILLKDPAVLSFPIKHFGFRLLTHM